MSANQREVQLVSGEKVFINPEAPIRRFPADELRPISADEKLLFVRVNENVIVAVNEKRSPESAWLFFFQERDGVYQRLADAATLSRMGDEVWGKDPVSFWVHGGGGKNNMVFVLPTD